MNSRSGLNVEHVAIWQDLNGLFLTSTRLHPCEPMTENITYSYCISLRLPIFSRTYQFYLQITRFQPWSLSPTVSKLPKGCFIDENLKLDTNALHVKANNDFCKAFSNIFLHPLFWILRQATKIGKTNYPSDANPFFQEKALNPSCLSWYEEYSCEVSVSNSQNSFRYFAKKEPHAFSWD